ncbi:MAG: sulfotransferase family protein [Psychrobium sp.]
MISNKIFIIGLPRTATTSVCKAMVELGFTTAHTAYIQKAFDQAQVLADTPIFCDYQQLDKFYPNSKFIHLEREIDVWVPSIRQLLERMLHNLQRTDGGFNPYLRRCYHDIFQPLTADNIASDDFLIECYQRHQQGIETYFKGREQDLLSIDVSQAGSYQALLDFVGITDSDKDDFERVNIGGKVTAWKQVESEFKVESTRRGRIDKLDYLENK